MPEHICRTAGNLCLLLPAARHLPVPTPCRLSNPVHAQEEVCMFVCCAVQSCLISSLIVLAASFSPRLQRGMKHACTTAADCSPAQSPPCNGVWLMTAHQSSSDELSSSSSPSLMIFHSAGTRTITTHNQHPSNERCKDSNTPVDESERLGPCSNHWFKSDIDHCCRRRHRSGKQHCQMQDAVSAMQVPITQL